MPIPVVDKEKCIGCGTCVALCPEVFDLDSEGKSYVKNPEGKCDNLKEVVESCPAGAISLK
ncbi:MAG: ferredoxin [Candidatus Aenigmarchaeota archaeon]|nr:ferredoxin [Candidatus Aenigmarchaeota archaeon]